ncbi:YncE family protein [Microbulbifer taiwanensis]
MAALLLSACGGSSSSGDNTNTEPVMDTELPTASILFPRQQGLWSDRDTLLVRGTASDNQGVASVVVNGIEATSDNGFATWLAEIPVSYGVLTEIHVTVVDVNGNANEGAAASTVNSYAQNESYKFCGPLAFDPSRNSIYVFNPLTELNLNENTEARLESELEEVTGALFDTRSGQFLVIEKDNLLSLDKQFNSVKVISSAEDSDVSFRGYSQIAIDEATGSIYVLDDDHSNLIKVNPENGERNIIDSWKSEGDLSLGQHRPGFVIDSGRFFAIISDALIELNPLDWSGTELSGKNVGEGPSLRWLSGLSIDMVNGKAYVGNSYNELIEIDLNTGDRTLVSAANEEDPLNLSFRYLRNGFIDIGESIAINSCWSGQTFSIEKSSGSRFSISRPTRGTGTYFNSAEQLKFDGFNKRLLVLNEVTADPWSYPQFDTAVQQVLSVSPENGDRSIVTGPNTGEGDINAWFVDIAVDSRNGNIYATDMRSKSIIQIDPVSGNRRVLSSAEKGSGPGGADLGRAGLTVDESRNRLLLAGGVSGEPESLISVDLDTGDRSTLVTYGGADTVKWVSSSYIEVDDLSVYAYLVNYEGVILSVDLETGLRRIVSGDGVGAGPDFREISNVAVDRKNNRLLVEHYKERDRENPEYDGLLYEDLPIEMELLSIDLETGDRKSLLSFTQRKNERMIMTPAVDPQSGEIYLSLPNLSISVFDEKTGQYLTVSQ